MQPWLKHDRLRRRNFLLPDCTCCGGGGGGLSTIPILCGVGTDMSEYWEIVASGFTDDTGTCTNANGTFLLEYTETCSGGSFGCCFEIPGTFTHTDNACTDRSTSKWTLGWLSPDWYVFVDSTEAGSSSFWSLADSSFDREGNNTFTETATGLGCCGTKPTTIQVNAVPPP